MDEPLAGTADSPLSVLMLEDSPLDADLTSALLAFADAIPHLLLDAPDLVLAINAAVAEEAVEEATPVFGWIALGVSVAATVAAVRRVVAAL